VKLEKFNEDTRVKIPATIQFLRLGYDYQSLNEAIANNFIEEDTNIFLNRFKPSLERINKKQFTDDEIENILQDIKQIVKNNDLGKEFYYWLINPQDKVKLIDFDNIENNDFAVCCELKFFNTQLGTHFRPDINILVNGMPLSFLEVKKPNNHEGIRAEFKRNEKRQTQPFNTRYFNMFQVVSFSNNMEYEEVDNVDNIRAGSFYSTPNGNKSVYSFLREDDDKYNYNYNYLHIPNDYIRYVTIDNHYNAENCDTPEFESNLKTTTPCNKFITSLYDKERFLYLIKYGILYVDEQIQEKHIMRYPQFFASRKIIERLKKGGKKGIIWHTQGSGKTALSAYSCNAIKDYYSKQDINTRFYFVVDRLDLLTQAEREFKKRGFNVVTCDDRDAFEKELNKPLPTNQPSDSIAEICVVNIHKFKNNIPKSSNDYGINVQRVFFIDEAHRSYSSVGTFFKNLLSADLDAVYLALTGTPILTKKERTNMKFGDYIHKYFYDKSIADGYTLRIKKEKIDTTVKNQIRNELKIVDDTDFDDPDTFESGNYIACIGKYIEKDFLQFREFPRDDSVGAMIVCKTNPQAVKMYEWFKNNTKLKTGLVISKENDAEQDKINKENQINFKNYGNEDTLDILVVNLMLTTGYDVNRLKRLYLLRGPKAHSLLQTVSRVNRPYKSPNGYIFKFGYIVDFVDIEKEYDATLAEYIKELEYEIKESDDTAPPLIGVVVDSKFVYEDYQKFKAELDSYHLETNNAEIFTQQIMLYNKDALIKLKNSLSGMKKAYMELLMSRSEEYIKLIGNDNVTNLLKCVNDRLSFLNIKEDPIGELVTLPGAEIGKIIYEFQKVKENLLDIGPSSQMDEDFANLRNILLAIRLELKKNENENDPQLKILNDWLMNVFDKLNDSTLDDVEVIIDEALEVLTEIKKINKENEIFIGKFDGNPAYLKTYHFISKNYNLDNDIINQILEVIFEDISEINNQILISQGRQNFINRINEDTTLELLNKGIFNKVKKCYTPILNEFYTNLKVYEEGLNAEY